MLIICRKQFLVLAFILACTGILFILYWNSRTLDGNRDEDDYQKTNYVSNITKEAHLNDDAIDGSYEKDSTERKEAFVSEEQSNDKNLSKKNEETLWEGDVPDAHDEKCSNHSNQWSLSEVNPVLVMTICQKNNTKAENDQKHSGNAINRQIEQVTNLIKSAAVLTKSIITFIIVVDKNSIFDSIIEQVERWPSEILQKINLLKRDIWFPSEDYRDLLTKVGSTARLFLAEHVLQDIDSAIYLDTDILFMRPPEELWMEFQHFDSSQMAGFGLMAIYDASWKTPFYGQSGFNAGMWLMNLTRMRNFPGGWEKACHAAYLEHKDNLTLADQDILNIIFYKYPQYLYEVPCNWNFRIYHCGTGKNICEASRRKGVYLLHGITQSFYNDNDLKIKILFDVWRNFEPGDPLSGLLDAFKMALDGANNKTDLTGCSKITGMNDVLLKGLEDYILNRAN